MHLETYYRPKMTAGQPNVFDLEIVMVHPFYFPHQVPTFQQLFLYTYSVIVKPGADA